LRTQRSPWAFIRVINEEEELWKKSGLKNSWAQCYVV
jgi:hypothetical protein